MGSKHNVDTWPKDNDQDVMDSTDVWKETVKKPSLKTLITWNVSKAIEYNPQIDLRIALSDIQERLESYDVQALISPDAHNLSCAFLAWQRLGHRNTDSLISFIKQNFNNSKNDENQCEVSYDCVNSECRDVTNEEISPRALGREDFRHKPKREWGSANGFGAPPGVVLKLPAESQLVMRLTSAVRVPKKPKQPSGGRHPPVRDTTRKINSACCMEAGCIKTLQSMEAENKALRERAALVAKRKSKRAELLDRAEMAWRELDCAYQRRLQQAQEKEDELEKKIANLLDERNSYKAACSPMVELLKKKSEQAEKEREAMKQLEQAVCAKACARLDLQENDAQASTQLTEHQCKISQLDRDLALSEELELRRQRMLASAVEAAQVVLHETEHAQRTELKALTAQVKQAAQELLEEDSRNGLLKDRIAEYLEQKEEMIEDLEECQTKCEVRMEDKTKNLKKLKEEMSDYEKKAEECVCKKPVNVAVEVKRTPSLAALCQCSQSEQFKETCSCISLTSKLLSALLRDLFGGLTSEMDSIGSQMPCHLLKCLEDKHKWDHSTDVKKHVRAYFSRLLLSELDIAISTAIEKKRDQWLHPPTRDSTHSSTSSHHAKTRTRSAKPAQRIFQDKAHQADDSGSYCECCKDDDQTPCPGYSSAVYRCLVHPQPARNMSKTKRVPTITTDIHNRKDKPFTQFMYAENVKKDTKGTTMPLLRTLQPLDISKRKNLKNRSIEKISSNNNSTYKSTAVHRRTFKAKKPNKLVNNKKNDGTPVKETTNDANKVIKVPQQFAINMCLYDKNNTFTSSDINIDHIESKRSCYHRNISQISSLRQTKPVLSFYPETKKLKKSEATALDSCTTKGECFHKLPSNTSVDRLISILTKRKGDLIDRTEERIQRALNADSLFKMNRTNIANNLRQLYSQMDGKKITEVVDEKCDKSKSSIQLPANQSEYMADINLDRSIDILHETKTNIEEERKNTIPLQCIHFAKCEGKGSVSADSKGQLVHRAEIDKRCTRDSIEKLPMINILHSSATNHKIENCIQCLGVTLTNAKSRQSLKKYSNSDNKNNELHHQRRKIYHSKSQCAINKNNSNEKQDTKTGDVTKFSSLFPKKCDSNIKFLGVLLDNIKSNRRVNEYSEEQHQNLDFYHHKIRYNDKSSSKRLNPKPDRGSSKTGYPVYETEATAREERTYDQYNDNDNLSVNKSVIIKNNNNGDDILNNEACICCPTFYGDDSNDLEVNTFQLLADHLKCQLEEFKVSVCKSSCMQNADEKSIVNEILLKVKKLILESASTVTSDCTRNKKISDGSWNRAHSLLHEYLKTKVERVRGLCDTSSTNVSKSLVPSVLSKISCLIDNDLQRLKDICKCKNVASSNKSIFKMHNTNNSINTEKNLTIPNTIELNAPTSKMDESTFLNCTNSNLTSLPYNKSAQALFHHLMETKSCDAIKTYSQVSEVQTDKESDTDSRLTFNGEDKSNKESNKANRRPDEHLDKTDKIVTVPVLPYIGCTMNCCCDRDIGCVCTKSTVLKNTDWLKNSSIWNAFTQKQSRNENVSYLLNSQSKSPKGLDITGDIFEIENIQTNKDDTCESGVSAIEELNVTLKISNPKLDMLLVHDATNDNSFPFISTSRNFQDHGILKRNTHAHELSKNDLKHLGSSRATMTTDDSKSQSSSTCNCEMVPVCHVKMLVDNIGIKLVKAECTCDSLKAVCPVHSQ